MIAYQALTTKLPFQADTTTGWMSKHCTEEPLNFDQVAPERKVPLALQQAVMKALVKDPTARYQSTLDLKKALEDALLPGAEEKARKEQEKPTLKVTPKTGKPPSAEGEKPAAKPPVAVFVSLGVVALSVAVVLAVTKPWASKDPSPPPTPNPLVNTPSEPTPSTGPTSTPTATPPEVKKPGPLTTPAGMIRYDGGELSLGSVDADDMNPTRTAKIAPFFLDKMEVSVGDYQGCVSANECFVIEDGESDNTFPVVSATFSDAQRFCAWRAKKDGAATRLPTEEEWEFAARDGRAQLYPWGNEWNDKAAFSALGVKEPAPHPASEVPPMGARADRPINLIGNVEEWVDATVPDSLDPECAGDKCRVVRGGSYESDDPKRLAASFRNWAPRNERSYAIGFRCAASAQ